MMLFMFLAFPLAIALALTMKDISEHGQKKVSLIIGFSIAVVYSFIDLFFTSAYFLTPYAFFPNFVYSFLYDIFIPAALCSAFLFFFVKKTEYRWCELFYILLGFYCVYLPARSLNINDIFGLYELVLKPLIIVCMVYAYKNITLWMYLYQKGKVELPFIKNTATLKVVSVFSYLLCTCIPAIIDSLYMVDISILLLLFVSVLYAFASTYLGIYIHRKI